MRAIQREDTIGASAPLTHGSRYRPDIQGLRGVAVLLVVAFHAGLGPRGGFLGVDVFLVISGFVVGRMLLDERVRTGSIRMRNFFARRVRRLLPAMAVFSIVTAVLSVLLLSPFGEQQRVLRTGMAATVFLANVELYRTTGYFDSSAEHNPFLHTWSLSLEEQFYMLLPLALTFAWWLAARRRHRVAPDDVAPGGVAPGGVAVGPVEGTHRVVLWAMGVMGVASLAASIVLTSETLNLALQAPGRLVFYSMPTRVWEFAAGVALASVGSSAGRISPRLRNVLGIAGLVALLAATVGLDPLAPQMNGWTVLAVTGTVAIIAAGTSEVSFARMLSVAPLVWVGDRSYGWYLWHWPLIVFTAVLWPERPYALVIAAVVSLVPTELSYRFVERRFRFGAQWTGRRAAGLAGVCIFVPLVVLAGLRFGADRHWGLHVPSAWYDLPETFGTNCHIINRDSANTFDLETCSFGPDSSEATGTVVVLGDELADAVGPGAVAAASARDWRTVLWSRDGCPMVLGAPGAHYPACARWQVRARRLIDELHPDVVVLANQFLTPAQREALPATVDALADRGVPVVLVAPVADFGETFPRLRVSVLNPTPAVPSLGRGEVEQARHGVTDALSRLAADRTGVVLVDPLDHLCDTRCSPVSNGHWQYRGPRALTASAARGLSGEFSDAFDDLVG